MKKTKLFLCFLCVLGLMAIFHTNTTANAAADISRGKWGEVDWTFNAETGALTFTGTGTAPDQVTSYDTLRGKVKTIEFQQSVTLQEHAELFAYMTHLRKITGLDKLDTSNVKDMSFMFYDCPELEQIEGIGNWNVSKVEKMGLMFDACDKLKRVDGLENWDVSNVKDMRSMFDDCKMLENIAFLSQWNTQNVEDVRYMFNGCERIKDLNALANWNTSSLKEFQGIFQKCKNLTDINGIANWNVENVEDMSELFFECESLSDLRALSHWNTKNVVRMSYMFSFCVSLKNIDALANWDTSHLKNVTMMFKGCSALVNADGMSGWRPLRLQGVGFLFDSCSSLESVNLETLDSRDFTENTSIDCLFWGCNNLKSITLGENSRLRCPQTGQYYHSNLACLFGVDTSTGAYTGEWIGVRTKHIYADNADFMDNYDGTVPDTYVWRRTPHQVNYQFVSETTGKELPAAVTDLLPSPISSSGALDSESIASPTLSATEIAADDGVWTFKGWDQASVAVSQTDETVTGTWTYTKKPKVCSITYHSNYPSSTQRQLKEVSELKLTLERPDAHMHTVRDPNQAELAYKWDGYKFKGWNTQRDGSGKSYAVGDKIQMSGTIDLYAQWEAIQDVTEPKKDDPTPPTSPTPPTTSSTTPPVTPPTTPPTSPANPKVKEPNPFVNHTTTTTVNGKGAPKLLPATGDGTTLTIWELCGGTVLLAVSYLFYQRRRKNSD